MAHKGGMQVRVMLEYIEDPADDPIRLDVSIEEETRMCVGTWPFYGLYGAFPKSRDLYPVLLLADGTLDFGTYAGSDRFWRTNIREREVRTGTYVAVWDPAGTEWGYNIKSVAVLGDREL